MQSVISPYDSLARTIAALLKFLHRVLFLLTALPSAPRRITVGRRLMLQIRSAGIDGRLIDRVRRFGVNAMSLSLVFHCDSLSGLLVKWPGGP